MVELTEKEAPLTQIVQVFVADLLNELMLIEAERFIDSHQEVMPDGRNRLVLHGTHRQRDVLFTFGPVPVKAPRVRDRVAGPEKIVFASRTLPRYLRKADDVTELIPWMYLRGMSVGDFQPVFENMFGPGVKGLSPTTISRLMDDWSDEFMAWDSRDMSAERYVYLFGDGVFFKVADVKENVCQLVLLGIDENGRKSLVGMSQGYAERADSWRELLVKVRSQGMEAPKLTLGDGALGLWSGLGKVFPDCARQHCWFHKTKDVCRHLPKGRHTEANRQLRDVYMSETREEAKRKIDLFANVYRLKHPQAAETLTRWADELTGFYDFPAEHWGHLRTNNVLESLFSTLRLRTDKTRGRLTRERLGALVFKLAQTATGRMNAFAHADKLKLLLAGVKFNDGEPMATKGADKA